MLHCNGTILRLGEVVFTATAFYPPEVVEAWKDRLAEKSLQPVEWQYIHGYYAQLYTTGDTDFVLDEIRVGKLDLPTFARQFGDSQPH
jgi:hypothetical protein